MTTRRNQWSARTGLLAAVLALVSFGAVGASPVAGATTAGGARVAPTAGALATNSLMSGGHATANSLDWAGYAVTGASMSTVTGSWVQPAATCTGKKATQSAFWVGIDGYVGSDPTVQQIGTDADCSKGTKKIPSSPSYYAWYELFPAAVVPIDMTAHPVSPGDVLTGTVSESGTSVTLSLSDAGHWSFSTTVSLATAPLVSSAEWIAEAPSSCKATKCKPVGLADFGSMAFTGASANGLPVDSLSFNLHQITMTKNKKGTIVKASPSALVGGTAFTVTWVSP